jgi:hypothetical protein
MNTLKLCCILELQNYSCEVFCLVVPNPHSRLSTLEESKRYLRSSGVLRRRTNISLKPRRKTELRICTGVLKIKRNCTSDCGLHNVMGTSRSCRQPRKATQACRISVVTLRRLTYCKRGPCVTAEGVVQVEIHHQLVEVNGTHVRNMCMLQ